MLYQSLRTLFEIKSLPNKDALLKLVLGIQGGEYLKALRSKEEVVMETKKCANTRLKSLIKAQASTVILYRLK